MRSHRILGKGFLILLCMTISFGFHGLTAAKAVPAGYPDVIEGLDFGGQEVFIYDWWSSGERVAQPSADLQRQYDYEDWLQETYNVKIIRKALSDWAGNPTELAEMVANKDSSKLCIVAVDGGFAGGPLSNNLFMPWTYGLDSGTYDQATLTFMTKNGVTYGVSESSTVEPRQGVFFNKRILEEAGIDWNALYDAQANGTWTWEAMEALMNKVQRDTDNDGEVDIWALTGNGDDVTIGLVASNNADFYGYDASGKLIPTIDTKEMKEAVSRRLEWGNKYLRPAESWDDYMQFWAEGNVAFMIGQAYEGFNGGSSTVNQCADDWGFLAMPMGPRADHYITAAGNNVFGVPNVYDAETAFKLEELFTLYNMPVPGVDENSWSSDYYSLTDVRAIEETYAMLRQSANAKVLLYNLLGDRNSTITEIAWNLGGGTAEEIIGDAEGAFQERCDNFNEAQATHQVDDNMALLIQEMNDLATKAKEVHTPVNNFVIRCYSVILGRDVDAEGLAGWSTALTEGSAAASQIIDGIVSSQEYANKHLSNEDSVKVLYQAMLGREPDADGLAAWTAVLDQGYPFGSVINGFCASNEFTALCDSYGIQPGSVNVGPVTPTPDDDSPRGKIEAFVRRCYQLILGREADAGGLQGWSDALESNTATAAQIIDGFVRSDEFTNRKLSDADSVDILYQTMLSREADEGGKAGWVQVLEQGNSYAAVINGFCGSEEFATLCNEYGITPGSITLMSGFYIGEGARLNKEKVTAFVQQNYSAVLGREADEQGLMDYTGALMNYLETPQQVIHDFIFSPEYQEQLPGNEAFITTLFQVYLGREPDPDGLAGWVDQLNAGVSLEAVVEGFGNSDEFGEIVSALTE